VFDFRRSQNFRGPVSLRTSAKVTISRRNFSGLERGRKLSLIAITGVGAILHANTRCYWNRCADDR
jgi:hypothetical protein